MKSTVQILLFSIISVVLYATFVQGCNNTKEKTKIVYLDGKPYEVLKHEIDTIVYQKIIKQKKDTVLIDTVIYVPVPSLVDTVAILKNFFAKNIYKDTIHLEDAGFIALTDTISQNKILGRLSHSVINQKVIKEITTVKEPNKSYLFLGFGSTFTNKNLSSLNTNLFYKTKKEKLLGIGTGIDLNKNIFLIFSYNWILK